MERLTDEELRILRSLCPKGGSVEKVIVELIAARPVVGAALQRHDAQLSHSFDAYSRANDVLMEECDVWQRVQRF